MQPPAEYQVWHTEMSACLGQTRPYHEIEWFRAAATSLGPYTGYWVAPNTIYVRFDQLDNEYLVKHELGHYIRQNANHDEELGACARQRRNYV